MFNKYTCHSRLARARIGSCSVCFSAATWVRRPGRTPSHTQSLQGRGPSRGLVSVTLSPPSPGVGFVDAGFCGMSRTLDFLFLPRPVGSTEDFFGAVSLLTNEIGTLPPPAPQDGRLCPDR